MKSTVVILAGMLIASMSSAATISVPNDYTTIQEAVDAAYNGDTVYVHSGLYSERVTVNKSISLVGESRESTIIDANGIRSALYVIADDVLVTELTLRGGGSFAQFSGLRTYEVSGLQVIGNRIIDNASHGIYGFGLKSSMITGNEILGDGSYGIYMDYHSDSNLIAENLISGALSSGIYLKEGSSYNSIETNIIADNGGRGIYITSWSGCPIENTIEGNSFIENGGIPYDVCYNMWDNLIASGNYWGDYQSRYPSATNDGLVWDTPYEIDGGVSADYFPLVAPSFQVPIFPSTSGAYYALVGESVQFHGSAVGGTEPLTWHWDFGDDATSDEQNPSHIFTAAGVFDVTLTVTDADERYGIRVTSASVKESNIPPNTPATPWGPSECTWRATLHTVATDPEGDQLLYQWDWGDGTLSDWVGPYTSGAECSMFHEWDTLGTYAVKARVKDGWDTSYWSVGFIISVQDWQCGDMNCSLDIDIDDVVYTIAYIFTGGPGPCPWPCIGDSDGSGAVDIDDVIYTLNYIFGGGDPPSPYCCAN